MNADRSLRRRRLLILAICASLLAAAILPALASANRPLGKFYCYVRGGGPYVGYLKLNSEGRYSFNDRYYGRYVYKTATQTVLFKTGYFSQGGQIYGKHVHSDGSTIVYIRVRGNPNTGYRCARSA